MSPNHKSSSRIFITAFSALLLLLSPLHPVYGGPADPAGTIVVDDKDTDFLEVVPESMQRKGFSDAVGGTALGFGNWAKTGKGDKQIRVSAEFPGAGLYQVWVRLSTEMKHAATGHANAPFTIHHEKGEDSFNLSMGDGGHWVMLGTYSFAVGRQLVLEMSDKGARGLAFFDAMKLIPVEAMPPARQAPPRVAAQDPMAQLRQAARDLHVQSRYGDGVLAGSPEARAKAVRAERQARILWDSMNDDFESNAAVWTSLEHTPSWYLTRQAVRLVELAAAYDGATNFLGTDLRGNPELLADLIRGLEAFQAKYNKDTKWDVNWWDYEIGVPENLLPALVILGDAVPEPIRQTFIDAAARFSKDPDRFYNNGFPNSGANRIWACRIHVYRGILENDPLRVAKAAEVAVTPFHYVERSDKDPLKTPEGFYEDGSFIAHKIPFVAAYGSLLFPAYADIATMLRGSPWETTDPAKQNAFRIPEASFDPFITHGGGVANVVGRSLGAANYEGNRIVAQYMEAALSLLPFAGEGEKARIQSLIKKWLVEDAYGNLLEEGMKKANIPGMLHLQEIASDDGIKPLPRERGFRSFSQMDQATHRTAEVTATLGMNSKRVKNFESIWGANLRGWFQSEGILLLYTNDLRRYEDGYWRAVNPYRFPGTTVERFPRNDQDRGGGNNQSWYGGSAFVGSLELDGLGVAAMEVNPPGKLEARKAWFFIGDQIVSLGAGIGADSEHTVETTVENTRRLSPEQVLVVNGETAPEAEKTWTAPKWAYLSPQNPGAGLGWVFLEGSPPLHTLLETRKGPSETDPELDFATLWFDHGVRAANAGYAYVTLVERDREQVERYAADPKVRVPVNTPSLQVVLDASAGYLGIVGWEAGAFGTIAFDQPCLLLMQRKGNLVRVAVSDPTMLLAEPLRLTLPDGVVPVGELDPAITVQGTAPLVLEMDLRNRFAEPVRFQLRFP